MDSPSLPRAAVRSDGRGLERSSPGQVAPAELSAFDGIDEARRLERIEEDINLVTRLMFAGYDGPEWREVARVLAGYGLQVIRTWVFSGEIFAKCRSKRIGLQRLPNKPGNVDRWDDAEGLANETVALAINAFRDKVLKLGKWQAKKGASLRTFFIGQCLFQFPNVYRAWVTQKSPPTLEGLLPEMILPATVAPDESAAFWKVMDSPQPDDPRLSIILKEIGYTQPEIAERLGVTWRAIESRQFRARAKAAL